MNILPKTSFFCHCRPLGPFFGLPTFFFLLWGSIEYRCGDHVVMGLPYTQCVPTPTPLSLADLIINGFLVYFFAEICWCWSALPHLIWIWISGTCFTKLLIFRHLFYKAPESQALVYKSLELCASVLGHTLYLWAKKFPIFVEDIDFVLQQQLFGEWGSD